MIVEAVPDPARHEVHDQELAHDENFRKTKILKNSFTVESILRFYCPFFRKNFKIIITFFFCHHYCSHFFTLERFATYEK